MSNYLKVPHHRPPSPPNLTTACLVGSSLRLLRSPGTRTPAFILALRPPIRRCGRRESCDRMAVGRARRGLGNPSRPPKWGRFAPAIVGPVFTPTPTWIGSNLAVERARLNSLKPRAASRKRIAPRRHRGCRPGAEQTDHLVAERAQPRPTATARCGRAATR
jgi:hypothetical protein